jgi:hypothetical protein
MNKKKAIKVAAASTVAASALIAAAPAQADAASNLQTVVDNAKMDMKAAYYAYSTPPQTEGKLVEESVIHAHYNKAKKSFAEAKAAVLASKASNKDALLADLDSVYNTYITKRVIPYIDAYTYATDRLQPKLVKLEEAREAKNWDDLEKYYHEISYELKAATAILYKFYGEAPRTLMLDQYKEVADSTRDALMYHVTIRMAYDKAAELLAADDLEGAKAQVEKVEPFLSKLDTTDEAYGEFATALQAKVEVVKDELEKAETPEVTEVAVVEEITVKAGEEVVLPEMVEVTYADETTKEVAVVWNTEDVDFSVAGTYELTGTIEGTELTASVTVVVEALPVLDAVEATNATTIQAVLPTDSSLTEEDFAGKTITLTAGETTLTATYVEKSLANGKANFQLESGKTLVDATNYAVTADWVTFATDNLVPKIAAVYAKTFEKATSEVISDAETTKVYFNAKNQYGEALTVNATNTDGVTVKATLNGMPLSSSEVSYTPGDNFVNVNHSLSVADNLVITLVSNKVESTLAYTVIKAPDTGLVASDLQVATDKTSIASGNSTTVKVTVKDQYNNPVAVNDGDIRWFVDGVEDTTQKGATFTFDKTASKEYKVQAFYANNSKLSQAVTISVGAAELKSVGVSGVDGVSVINNEAINAFTVTQNEGALLNPTDLKYVVTGKPEAAKNEDISVTFAYGEKDNTATPKVDETKVIYAKVDTDVAGTYKFKVFTGTAVDAEGAIVSAEQTVTSTIRQDVTSIGVEDFAANELTEGKVVTKAITFENKHNEVLNVNASDIKVVSTENMTITLLNKDKEDVTTAADKVVKFVSFEGDVKGQDTVTFVKGSVSKSLTLTTLAASTVNRIDATGLTGTNAIVAGDTTAKYIELNVFDQYNVASLDNSLLKVEVKAPGASSEFGSSALASLVYLDKDGKETADMTKAVKSAVKINPAEAKVAAELAAGNYTVKVSSKADNLVTKEVTVEAKAKRALETVTASATNQQFTLGSNGSINFVTKDQYGQVIALDSTSVKVKSDTAGSGVLSGITDQEAPVSLTAVEDNDGKLTGYKLGVTAAAKGNATITFTVGGKTVNVNVSVDSVGSLVDSVSLATAENQKSLYYTKGADNKDVVLKATAKNSSGSEVPVTNADLIWSVDSINGTVVVDGKEVAATKDLVTVSNGVVNAPETFKGKVTFKVTTSNLKSSTLELNFDSADRAPVTGTTAVTEAVAKALDADTATAGIQVVLDGKGEDEASGAVTVTLDGVDQYGDTFNIAESGAIVTTGDSSVVSLAKSAEAITVTAKGEGSSKVYVQYNGDTIVLDVTVTEAAFVNANLATAKSSIPADLTVYTAETEKAVTDAQALPETTDQEKIAKTTAINSAVAGLVFQVDAELVAAKATIPADLTVYTTASAEAVTVANALPETTDQEKVTKTSAINDAVAGLVTLVEEATTAVEEAEVSKLQADVDAAQKLVTALPASQGKTDLQTRIDAIVVAS